MVLITLVEIKTLGERYLRTDKALFFFDGIIFFKLAVSIPPFSVPKIHYCA